MELDFHPNEVHLNSSRSNRRLEQQQLRVEEHYVQSTSTALSASRLPAHALMGCREALNASARGDASHCDDVLADDLQ